MALTKSTTAAQASATNAAAGTTTGGWIDVSGAYESTVLASITNGGSGPTLPCTARVDLSPDGATIYVGAGGSFAAGVAASASYSAAFPLGGDTMYARVVFAGNTGQSVTVRADITRITAL